MDWVRDSKRFDFEVTVDYGVSIGCLLRWCMTRPKRIMGYKDKGNTRIKVSALDNLVFVVKIIK